MTPISDFGFRIPQSAIRMGKEPLTAFFAVLSWLVLMSALAVSQNESQKTYTYADPEGRFSFQVLGDWIKLPADVEKGIVGSFILTKDVGGKRNVVAELLISRAELETPISLEEYVKAEDRRAMKTPGFKRIGSQESRTLGDCPAVRNRYSFSRQAGSEQLQHVEAGSFRLLSKRLEAVSTKVVCQYYAVKEKAIWGITLSALAQDEPILAEIERLILSSFQFSVPEGSRGTSLEVLKKVTIGGTMGGFSLSVPETWEVSQSDDEGAFVRGAEAVVYAFAIPWEKKQDSPQALAGRFLKERENLKELRVLSQGVGELGRVKGYAVEYSGTAKGRRWHVRLLTSVSAERVFFLYCVAPEEMWPRSSEVLRRVERSFSVATPAAKMEDGR